MKNSIRINELDLLNLGPFKNEKVILNRLNFFFGLNGSGKTTISRRLRNYEVSPDTDVLVFNNDFINDNFSKTSEIRGIFTFGKEANIAKENVESIKKQLTEIRKNKDDYEETLSSTQKQLDELTKEFYDESWKIKKKIDKDVEEFTNASKASKRRFAEYFLDFQFEGEVPEESELIKKCRDFLKLKNKYYSIISKLPEFSFSIEEVQNWLETQFVPKSNSQITSFFNQLENISWTKLGLEFLDKEPDTNDKKCPFCARQLPDDLIKEIRSVFDHQYEENIAKGDAFLNKLSNIERQYSSISLPEIVGDFKTFLLNLIYLVQSLKAQIEAKKKQPQNSIYLDASIFEKEREIQNYIASINSQISSLNQAILNKKSEHQKLSNLADQFIFCELRDSIKRFKDKKENLLQAINHISNNIDYYREQTETLSNFLDKENNKISDLKGTVDFINGILNTYNFRNFKLVSNEDTKFYSIVRDDNSDVGDTLSEGEKRIISFLYFYSLVKQHVEQGNKEIVLVIDDPVTSLDSQSLFLISSLIKTYREQCLEDEGSINQFILLTHNTYFFHEITSLPARFRKAGYVSFFVITKDDEGSHISYNYENPICSSYESLWRMVKSKDNSDVVKLNCMRQILDYYFNFIGQTDYESLIPQFDEKDKILAYALISAINQGSHSLAEDIDLSLTYGNLDNLMNVFKRFFELTNQVEHFNLMMK